MYLLWLCMFRRVHMWLSNNAAMWHYALMDMSTMLGTYVIIKVEIIKQMLTVTLLMYRN